MGPEGVKEEANALFPGYQQAAERAGLLIAAPDFNHLRRAYREYCESFLIGAYGLGEGKNKAGRQ